MFRSDTLGIAGNPWREMSDVEVKHSAPARKATHLSLDRTHNDPWIRNTNSHSNKKLSTSRNNLKSSSVNLEAVREGARRGKLERVSPVVCEGCGNESCECWRPRTPRLTELRHAHAAPAAGPEALRVSPRRGRAAGERSPSVDVKLACTCEPVARLSPRLAGRALSDEGEPPAAAATRLQSDKPLYKSSSQRYICADKPAEADKKAPIDPLLETTC